MENWWLWIFIELLYIYLFDVWCVWGDVVFCFRVKIFFVFVYRGMNVLVMIFEGGNIVICNEWRCLKLEEKFIMNVYKNFCFYCF